MNRYKALFLSVIFCLAPLLNASNHVDNNEAIIRYKSIHHPIYGTRGMVASQRMQASRIGAEVLLKGGNAVDAAIATAMALAVVLPRAGNLGGGGFMLIHLAEQDKTVAIDYREKAPTSAHRDLFLNSSGEVDKHRERFSLQSSGIPGTVAGLYHAHRQYGSLPWQEILQPAIALAENGIEVSFDLSENLKKRKVWLTSNLATRDAYFKKDGEVYQPGELLVQQDLANTLKLIAEQGAKAFYQGLIAEKIVEEMQRDNGLISMSDLVNYQPKERPVISTNYRGYEVVSMPPPSSGGVHIAQMLNILEHYNLSEMGYGSAKSLHYIAEAMKRAYSDRSKYLGDSDFYPVPIEGITSKAYAKKLAKSISFKKATPSKKIKPGNPLAYESPDTTHFSIIDKFGNAVANTYTLNFSFGSGIVVPGTGMLLNNEMADFSAKSGVADAFGLLGGEANQITAGKRPLSSMTPVIVLKNGKPFLVTGSPGGSRIISTVLQMIINVIDFDMNVAAATHSPRIHHQWQPDKLYHESGFSADTLAILKRKGHRLSSSNSLGSLQSVLWDNGLLQGASDPRRPGAGAVGLN